MPRVHFAKSSLHQNSSAEQQTQMHDIPDHFTPQDHDMLRVSPQDFLKFSRGDSKESVLELTNTNLLPVTYKIQTTSPEKFRVRPRLGILNPGDNIFVSIYLKPEHNLSENGKDKFLIMCLPAADVEPNQNADFWKKVDNNDANVEQHRLCCVYKNSDILPKTAAMSNGYSSNSGDRNLENSTKVLTDDTRRLEKQLRNTQILQVATLLIVIILSAAVIYLLKLQLCNDDGCFNKEESCNLTKQRLLNAAAAATTKCRNLKTVNLHKLIKACQCPDGYIATRVEDESGISGMLMENSYNFQMHCKKDGGVIGGGYLLGLIAFARKFARCILTLTMLMGIVCITFYFCSMYRESNSAITTSALLHVTEAEYTITSLNWDS